MSEIITVADLIDVLKHVDQKLPIATFAMGRFYALGLHSFSHGPLRVALMDTYREAHVAIGDLGMEPLSGTMPNWGFRCALDGGPAIESKGYPLPKSHPDRR